MRSRGKGELTIRSRVKKVFFTFFKKFCINAVDEKLKKQFDRQIPWAPTFSVNHVRMI